MPNRLFREGFVDSESVSSLSDWTHRVYSNLLIKADDAGRFDGRIEFLRSQLFPLGTNRRSEDFRKALDEMSSPKSPANAPLPALIIQYENAGKPYIQLTKVSRCGKSTVSKYPWKDGSFEFRYTKRQTRDGSKEYVSTSLTDPMPTPCGRDKDRSDTSSDLSAETETETETETDAPPVGGIERPNDVENAFVRRVFDDVRWLVAAQINPKKLERLVGLIGAIGEDEARKILDSAPSKCDKSGIDVWLAWSMTTMASRLAETPKPKRSSIPKPAAIRPSPNRKAS